MGVWVVCSNPTLSPNYFIFKGNLKKSCIYCLKNPQKSKACILFQWNIETYQLYTLINLWKFTKSKTSPKGSIVSVISKIRNTLKMMKIAEHFSCFETNWNKTHIWCFETFLKRTETWQKLTNVSVVLKCFETKLKQALEKVKIPGPISGVSKHWNNGLYREKTETDWNMTKID